MKQILLFICLLCPVSIMAQTLSGKITDKTGMPIAFANIILMGTDSSFITGNVSKENGTFLLEHIKNATLLKVSYIGYLERILPIKLDQTDMGIIKLEEEAMTLGEVVVKGNLPTTQIKGDALVTSIQNSVLAKVGSANDVLAKIPGIIKKRDAFEVFGKGTPLIYINNRMVRNPEELEQLNSDEIKNIEVVTNPGSRYDATAKAIIRIQTIKRKGDGFGFDLRSSYYQSQNTDLIDRLNFNYRHENFDIFGSFNYKHNETLEDVHIEQENQVNNIWKQKNLANYYSKSDNLEGVLGINYMVNENHSLGIRYDIITRPKSYIETLVQSNVLKNEEFYDNWSSRNTTDENYKPEHQLNIYYNGKIKNFSIDFNTDYFRKRYEAIAVTKEHSQEHEERNIYSFNPVDNQLAAAKLIISNPLLGGELSWGSEYTHTMRNDDYLSLSTDYIPTSYSKIEEDNISAFVEYNRKLPFGQLSVGARYEHVAFEYYEDHQYMDGQSRKYDNIYPNISFGSQLGKVQMQLSYTAKTKRPSYRDLSNNVSYINRFTLQQGNPALLPALRHDITLMGSWKFMQLTISYQQMIDEAIPWGKPKDDNPEVTILKPINFRKIPTLNAFIAAAPNIGCWSPTFGIGISKQWMTIESSDLSIRMDHPMLTASFENIISLPKDFIFEIDLSYQGKGHYMNIYSDINIWGCDVSIRKSFFKDALSIELEGYDLFYKQRQNNTVYFERMKAIQIGRFDTREFALTVRYKFNTTKSKYKGSGAGTQEKNRL